MESILEIYKIGYGPSSSHTMGPSIASKKFKEKYPNATSYECILYGSLALTGRGHLTDYIIRKTFSPSEIKITFDYDTLFDYHPNAMKLIAYKENQVLGDWLVFSVGGGSLKELNEERSTFSEKVYPHSQMNEILDYCDQEKITLVEYVKRFEKPTLDKSLDIIINQMKKTIENGINTTGVLPGRLQVKKRANDFYNQYLKEPTRESLVYSYVLASGEENASGGIVVTAPTCGSCPVVPGVLLSYQKEKNLSNDEIKNALIISGLIGNIVKTNASISGAEVGCQGEIGVACAMAAAGLVYLQGGNNYDCEYAAEIALEHHLGMTCDPVDGMVQIPCIERNAVAAMQAYNVVSYVKLAGNEHNITLDGVIQVMKETGKDLHAKYRETSTGGLATHKRG